MKKEELINKLNNMEYSIIEDMSDWGSATIISYDGIGEVMGGDCQVISDPIIINDSQFGEVSKAIKEKREISIPEEWDDYEWKEAVLMVNEGCLPNIEYLKVVKDDWDEKPQFFTDRESAEEAVYSNWSDIAGSDMYSSMEYWEDMDTETLLYWWRIVEEHSSKRK